MSQNINLQMSSDLGGTWVVGPAADIDLSLVTYGFAVLRTQIYGDFFLNNKGRFSTSYGSRTAMALTPRPLEPPPTPGTNLGACIVDYHSVTPNVGYVLVGDSRMAEVGSAAMQNIAPFSPASTIAARDVSLRGSASADWTPGTPLYDAIVAAINDLKAVNPAMTIYVIIMLGTNDANLTHLTPRATYKSNIQNLATGVLNLGVTPILNSVSSVTANSGQWDESAGVRIDSYNQTLIEIAQANPSIKLGDTLAYLQVPPNAYYTIEGTHYTEAGVRTMGLLSANAILRVRGVFPSSTGPTLSDILDGVTERILQNPSAPLKNNGQGILTTRQEVIQV